MNHPFSHPLLVDLIVDCNAADSWYEAKWSVCFTHPSHFQFHSPSCPVQRRIVLVRCSSSPPHSLVSLTQTKEKGREHKDVVVNKIREAVDNYKYIYVLQFDNMRTNAFKELRSQLADSRYSAKSSSIIK